MTALGQTEKNSVRAYVFRFALERGHSSWRSACLRRANKRHQSAFDHLNISVLPNHGLRSPFVHLVATTVVPLCVGPWTRLRTAVEVITPPPQGPSLGSGL
jgi:hypothetical protein